MSKAATPVKVRKTPQRSCVACGAHDAKKSLVRLVRSKDGVVACDASGRAAGRGAYLCASEACFTAVQRRDRLSRALKCAVSAEDYERLHLEFEQLIAKKDVAAAE